MSKLILVRTVVRNLLAAFFIAGFWWVVPYLIHKPEIQYEFSACLKWASATFMVLMLPWVFHEE
jgi:hypothetical protein